MRTGFIDINDTRKFLGGCGLTTIHRLVHAGKLTKYKLGTKTLFKMSEVEQVPVLESGKPENENEPETVQTEAA